ncbi:hypothetical protein QBC46DRAFT_43220 [Diplogelasinospora grovesii]|uniref:Uncharacterized protein n=1 Tax=Diplogelasinospora grovesii TaxID=303347 RepID=A0AAN6NDS9_9PEZI|nr:hypothetical protein QBC46DRAFT_43220 [Diplogelasinospora grovesii]
MTNRMKYVLITGASEGGIGNALALAILPRIRLCPLPLKDVQPSSLRSSRMTLLKLDITSPNSIRSTVSTISSLTNGRLDILVNNSGQSYLAPALDTPLSTIRNLFNVNFFGLVELTQRLSSLIIPTQRTIINIGSLAAHIHPPPLGGILLSDQSCRAFLWGDTQTRVATVRCESVDGCYWLPCKPT